MSQADRHLELAVVDSGSGEARRGLGSTFTVRLPSVSGPVPSAEEVHELETRLGKRRILVIDDDADILELMRFAVEQRGAYVETVQSAAAALDKLATGRYDVL